MFRHIPLRIHHYFPLPPPLAAICVAFDRGINDFHEAHVRSSRKLPAVEDVSTGADVGRPGEHGCYEGVLGGGGGGGGAGMQMGARRGISKRIKGVRTK